MKEYFFACDFLTYAGLYDIWQCDMFPFNFSLWAKDF